MKCGRHPISSPGFLREPRFRRRQWITGKSMDDCNEEKLFVSELRVKSLLRKINSNLGAQNRTQAVAIGRTRGLIQKPRGRPRGARAPCGQTSRDRLSIRPVRFRNVEFIARVAHLPAAASNTPCSRKNLHPNHELSESQRLTLECADFHAASCRPACIHLRKYRGYGFRAGRKWRPPIMTITRWEAAPRRTAGT
ncbi:hypothetical protein AWB68_02906 [Caballeronia choica]|uniref:Uncharacterized protein n=1 Tax=Caballeronia choica TaxID=326476 RepID=A0A158IPR1_9BURK|nr:hypothetical protein AWB68_02906 [Caballeronia choica]